MQAVRPLAPAVSKLAGQLLHAVLPVSAPLLATVLTGHAVVPKGANRKCVNKVNGWLLVAQCGARTNAEVRIALRGQAGGAG